MDENQPLKYYTNLYEGMLISTLEPGTWESANILTQILLMEAIGLPKVFFTYLYIHHWCKYRHVGCHLCHPPFWLVTVFIKDPRALAKASIESTIGWSCSVHSNLWLKDECFGNNLFVLRRHSEPLNTTATSLSASAWRKMRSFTDPRKPKLFALHSSPADYQKRWANQRFTKWPMCMFTTFHARCKFSLWTPRIETRNGQCSANQLTCHDCCYGHTRHPEIIAIWTACSCGSSCLFFTYFYPMASRTRTRSPRGQHSQAALLSRSILEMAASRDEVIAQKVCSEAGRQKNPDGLPDWKGKGVSRC